jgi:type I restriction-modification system DNA methylase subunit
MHSFDLELTSQDIQALHGPDSLAAFLTNLGYDTRARIAQTAANLGIPDPVQRRIKRIELLADHDRFLQVYLFELKSVTVADIKAISRVFRDKAGNFLFVLTADYEYIEFVLLDRVGESKSPTAISTAPPSLVQRRFSVDRRKPTPVHLRVLRRFTWTESDPFGQFDKLRFAYDLAHWSEVYFNNRGLFSDYYLRERLPARDGKVVEFAEWREDPKPAYQRLRAIYGEAAVRFPGKKASELVGLLYEPLLRELGFTPSVQTSGDRGLHLRLNDPDSGALLAICLPYPWGRELDRKDEMHDTETPEVTPTFAVVDLLANENAPWVVLTNGKLWRLYSQRAHSRATNYYEIDLDEILGRQGFQQDIQDAFRYFWLLFRAQAFRPVERDWQGERQALSMIDRLLLGSEEYAKELGENLKNRVFTEAFPILAEGFIANMRQRGDSDLDDHKLATVFQGTLTLLYRLLFLLYAESRDLLPIHTREYRGASLQRTKDEIKEAAGAISEANSSGVDSTQERTSRINKAFSVSEFGLWQRLKRLFDVIDQGSEELNVPRYNGGLFQSKRNNDDHSPEAEAARFLERERIADRHLALALDLLARDEDRKTKALAFIDYKSLGVRQLGSIYEGLLEFRLRIAGAKLAIVKEKGREVYTLFQELSDREKKKAEAQKAFVSRGHAYLENDKRERKATGSYYTPDHIVKYIVEHAVGPVLQEKFDALRPKLREAQRERREFFKQQEQFTKHSMKPKPPEQADLIGRELVDEIFNIKVLDPAMGSGHFLVEAVDFITDKALEFLNGFPWNPVLVYLERMRKTIQDQMEEQNIDMDAKRLTDVNLLKRHVLKRCIYGVDLNPMAVELAKVSLWLDCFTLGAPLSFLDHHLRWGNSLIGSTIVEVDAIREAKGQLTLTGTSDWQGLTQAVQAMVDVGGMPDVTADQVADSKRHFQSALDDVEVFKRVLDLHTARWFVELGKSTSTGRKSKIDIFDEMLRSGELFEWAHGRISSPVSHTGMAKSGGDAVEQITLVADQHKFFHWELEFPEVFYGRRAGTQNAVERLENAGFDAVVGNPPYDEPSEFYSDTSAPEKHYLSEASPYEGFKNGRLNLYRLFILRGVQQLAKSRIISYIVPMSLLADDFSKPVREYLLDENDILTIEAFPQKDDPKRRVFVEAKLSTCVAAIRRKPGSGRLTVTTHAAADFEKNSPSYQTSSTQLHSVFRRHVVIPTVSEEEWLTMQRIFGHPDWPTLSDVADIYVGEIFDNAPNRKFLSDDPVGPIVLRGANLDRYLLREKATQGAPRYLREKAFNSGKGKAGKSELRQFDRIGIQRGSAVDNWRRLIGAIVPPGHYCFDTVLLVRARLIPLRVLLGVINSDLWEWRFRCTSMTNHVNEYDLADLAIPPTLTDLKSHPAAILDDHVKVLLRASSANVRRSEWQDVREDSVDKLIDTSVFEAYGVSQADRKTILESLRRQTAVRVRSTESNE